MFTDFLIFSVGNSSSSHTDNRKNNFLVLGEGPTDDINGSVDVQNKSLVLTLVKKKFCLSLHDNGDNSYFLLTEKK